MIRQRLGAWGGKLGAVFVWVAVIAGVVWGQQPPSPLDKEASLERFSAGRAMVHVRAIAQRPHPVGSPANAAVRTYLLAVIQRLGYQPVVQRATLPSKGLDRRVKHLAGASVHNILVRIKGRRSSGLLAVVAHYDSGFRAPGAADDGAAVAAMLEVLRLLRRQPPLANDVLFLFTDAEEIGLWGARLFARQHPWSKEIKAVLNFEARGASGPSLMFETAPGNGAIVDAFARFDPMPRGSSLFYEVYRRLPNDTDFTVFKKRGVQGLNFAWIESLRHYHQPSDTPANLSRASLQDHGAHMAALVRGLGAMNLTKLKAPDVVYFDLGGRVLVRYGHGWAWLWTLLSVALALGLMVTWWRRGRIRLGRAGPAVVLLLAGAVGLGWGVGWLARQLLAWKGTKLYAFYYLIPHDGAWIVVFAGLSVALFLAWLAFFSRWIGRLEWAVAGLLIAAVLAVLLLWKVPGASYLMTWPLLGATLATIGLGWLAPSHDHPDRSHDHPDRSPAVWALWCLELSVVLLAVPLLYHLPYGLTLSFTGVTALLTGLYLALSPVTQTIFQRGGRWWSVAVFGGGALALGGGLLLGM